MQAQLASLSASYEGAQAALNSSGQALAQKEADAAGGDGMEEGLAWMVRTGGWVAGWVAPDASQSGAHCVSSPCAVCCPTDAGLQQQLEAVTSDMQARLDDANAQLQQRTQAFDDSQAALATMQAEMDGVTQRVAQMEGDMAGEGAHVVRLFRGMPVRACCA